MEVCIVTAIESGALKLGINFAGICSFTYISDPPPLLSSLSHVLSCTLKSLSFRNVTKPGRLISPSK